MWDKENLIWAPNKVKGVHGAAVQEKVHQILKTASDSKGATKDSVIDALRTAGEKVAKGTIMD